MLSISRPDLTTTLRVIAGTGEAQRTFIVYKNVLCAGSHFFKGSCRWQEHENATVRLPKEDPKITKIYLEWLVTGYLSEYFKISLPITENDLHRFHTLAANLYVFGDFVQDLDFKNSLVNETLIIADCTKAFSFEIISLVYNKTPVNSLYRRLVVDLWIIFAMRNAEKYANDLSKDFLVDVVIRMPIFLGHLHRSPPKLATFNAELYQYHEHELDKPVHSAPRTGTLVIEEGAAIAL